MPKMALVLVISSGWLALAPAAQQQSAFLDAVLSGDIEAVQALLEQGVNVDTTDEVGRTALFIAIEAGHNDVAQLLVESGADVNARDPTYGRGPLFAALLTGNVEVVLLLAKEGSEGMGLLLRQGARVGREEYLELALASENLVPEARTCALVVAINGGRDAIAERLREAGAVEPGEWDETTVQRYEGFYEAADAWLSFFAEGSDLLLEGDFRLKKLIVLDGTTAVACSSGIGGAPQLDPQVFAFRVEGGEVVGVTRTAGGVETFFERIQEERP